MDQSPCNAAEIAAEVLKVALPNATIIPYPEGDRDAALAWWDNVQVFDSAKIFKLSAASLVA